MKLSLDELTVPQVIGTNYRVILDAKRKDPACQQMHQIRGASPGPLQSCVDSIFMQLVNVGYAHAPLEKMAAVRGMSPSASIIKCLLLSAGPYSYAMSYQ